jgi:hypothetical protein
MPISAWCALAIAMAVLGTIIEALTNDYFEGEVFLRVLRWIQIQFILWAALVVIAVVVAWVL